MIKIYFDWNVLSQMKNGNHSELKEIIQQNNNLLIPFSTSHISDISASFSENEQQLNFIESDLEFISEITKDYCLYNNGKGVILDVYPPKELFNQTIEDKERFADLSIDGLMKSFEGNEMAENLAKPLFELLKTIPLDQAFKEAFENPESADIMNRMFPGLKDNPTMDGFFKSFSKMNFNLNESDGYKDLRETIQNGTGINRDKIFDSKDPFKYIDESYEKLNLSVDNLNKKPDSTPQWFEDIQNEYIKLDMHGYQEDKVNITKGRKETYKNTTEDAFHAAFASTCNFYVINDKKSYKKTKKVYEKLKINTRVFKPEEFLDYYKKYLGYENPALDFNIMENLINSEHFELVESESGIYKYYFFPYFLFGFFNKIVIFYPNEENEDITTFLSQDKPTNWFILNKEVETLLQRLLNFFGKDDEDLGELKSDEFNMEKWNGRKWKFDNATWRLQSFNGYVQLYLDFESKKPAGNKELS